MNRGPLIFLGAFLTFSFAWFGLVFSPYLQMEGIDSYRDPETGSYYPRDMEGAAARGRKVYAAMGCVYCHTQQIRPDTRPRMDQPPGPDNKPFSTDILRFGGRRTVPLDYIYDKPVFLGTMRTGPDLSNIGNRWSDVDQHKHLYNPRFKLDASIMPAFRFLYEWVLEGDVAEIDKPLLAKLEKRVERQKPDDPEPWNWPTKKGESLVPTRNARDLVAYLLELKKVGDLPKPKQP